MTSMDIFESYMMEMDRQFDTSSGMIHPVYIMLMHTGTALANTIRHVTGDSFSHCTISFDLSMREMYSFGRKYMDNPLVGGFAKEDIQSKFYTNRHVTYALYTVFCTEEEAMLMRQHLEYFIHYGKRFTYDFIGLIRNYFKIDHNPKTTWFCSRFVADILSAAKSPNKRFILTPSLTRPQDFVDMPFTVYIMGGDLSEYNPMKAKRIVREYLANPDSINQGRKKMNMIEGVTSMDITSRDVLGEMFYEFFGEMPPESRWTNGYILENDNNIPDEIEPIVKIIEDKGYDVKYASPGYVDGHFKGDRNKDGVVNGKMVSTGRVIFARNYRFGKTPEGWGWKALHNGFKALYVKPHSENPDIPNEANVIKWHNDCLRNLRKWAEELPEMGTLKDSDLEEDKHFTTL